MTRRTGRSEPIRQRKGYTVATYTVAACGFPAARLRAHPEHERVRELPDPTAPDFVEAGRAMLERCDPAEPVLLLHSERRGQAGRAGMLRALSRRHTVVPVSLRFPPTGLSARATWLASLAGRRVPAGLALAHLERHRRWLPTCATLSSVTRLDARGVRFGQHAASYLPWVSFGVVVDDEIRVETRRSPEVTPQPFQFDRVVRGRAELETRVDFGIPLTGETFALPGSHPATEWWGSARFFEQTLIPRDVREAVRLLAQDSYGRCPSCRSVTSGHCPMCMTQEEVVA